MDFLNEFAEILIRYARVRAYNGFDVGEDRFVLTYGPCARSVLWYKDGVYCFDEEERGSVQSGGMFNSSSFDQVQKVMLNYTVSILRNTLRFVSIGVPISSDEMPDGWSLHKKSYSYYDCLMKDGRRMVELESADVRLCVPLAWLYGVSPSELLHAYMLPDGGPLLRRWLGRHYVR